MVHHANRVRPNPSGLKVGGHQASSASMVSIMAALWFEQLQPGDRVSVKPHASPVLHAINYLLGELDERYLTTLRAYAGLQSYPSRTKARAPGRQYSLVGGAGLAEGGCWEAILDPMVGELGEIVWIVDLNRQSLDRVVPNTRASRPQGLLDAGGWTAR